MASIFSDGFADAGAEGAARQARLAARAKELGVRLLGPNSMGVIDIPGRLALTVNAVLEMDALPAGGTSIVSQSGTMLGTVLSRGAARGLGFAKLVSVGNEADLGVGELVELLADDADTRVILLFLETVRDAERLAAAARRAHAAGKPVVAYKLGRSALGERLARSHTGALAGSDAALDAYFRDCGILRVDMLETLIEIAPLVERARAGRAQARTPRCGGHHHRRWRGERGRPARRLGHRDRRAGQRRADHRPHHGRHVGPVRLDARLAARLARVRRGAGGGRLVGDVPPAARGRADPQGAARGQAAGRLSHPARRAVARAARARRSARVSHP